MELCHNGRGHEAFKQGDFPRAIGIWSLALEAQEGPAAVILGNRSAAHARLGCWSEALHDAEQAVKLQPDNVRALYRLASAQYSLQQLHQCVQTCTTALHVKPNAKQLQLLLCQAEESLRIGFLTNRHPEVICAVSMTAFTATQQAEHNSRRQYLAHTKLQDKATLAQSRRHTDAVQREEFMQWCEFDHCSKSFQLSGSVVEMADTDSALKVLGINQNANLKDIRNAYVRAMMSAHPDKGGSAQAFCEVQAAYNLLAQAAMK